MDPTRASVGVFLGPSSWVAAHLFPGGGDVFEWAYKCMSILLCLAQAFMCSLGLGHSLHSQSTLSHSTPHPRPPFLTFF